MREMGKSACLVCGRLLQAKERTGKGDVLGDESLHSVTIAIFGSQTDNALVLTGL
jgi:hypothetical protein